jgi:hypothetical protein
MKAPCSLVASKDGNEATDFDEAVAHVGGAAQRKESYSRLKPNVVMKGLFLLLNC